MRVRLRTSSANVISSPKLLNSNFIASSPMFFTMAVTTEDFQIRIYLLTQSLISLVMNLQCLSASTPLTAKIGGCEPKPAPPIPLLRYDVLKILIAEFSHTTPRRAGSYPTWANPGRPNLAITKPTQSCRTIPEPIAPNPALPDLTLPERTAPDLATPCPTVAHRTPADRTTPYRTAPYLTIANRAIPNPDEPKPRQTEPKRGEPCHKSYWGMSS